MAKIPEHTIEQIRESTDIVDLVSDYVPLQQRGRNYFGICPFHQEDTASFSVSPDKQIYHCFGCGQGGNVYSFLMEYERIDFIEAVKKLADRAGVDLPKFSRSESKKSSESVGDLYEANAFAMRLYKKALYSDKGFDAMNYLKKREFSEETLQTFQVGYAPDEWEMLVKWGPKNGHTRSALRKAGLVIQRNSGSGEFDRFRNRVMFPIQNVSGRVVAFGGRALDPNDKAKYMNSPESPVYQKRKVLYGLHQSRDEIRKTTQVFIVEGYTDVMRLWESGIRNVIAVSGTAFTEEHGKIISRYASRAYLCYDNDDAGSKATISAGKILLQSGVEVQCIMFPDGHDPDSYIAEETPAAFLELTNKASSLLQFRAEMQAEKLRSATAKAQFIHEALEDIADIGDSITQELQIHELAEIVKLDETRLLQEFRSKHSGNRTRTRTKSSQGSRIKNRSHEEFNRLALAQYELIKLLLSDDEHLITYILERVTLEEFSHPLLNKMATVITGELAHNPILESDKLLDLLRDSLEETPETVSKIQKIASKMLFEIEELNQSSRNEKLAKDCLRQMEVAQLEREVEKLNTELQQNRKVSESTFDLLQRRQNLEQLKREILVKYE